jgi:hypothetical protein
MDVTKPCEFTGFGAMDVTKPYEFIGFGAALAICTIYGPSSLSSYCLTGVPPDPS